MLMMLSILALLVGMVLGQRFKIQILAPAIFLALLVSVGTGIARAEQWQTVGLTAAAAITCLQLGYLAGAGIRRLLVAARASRLRRTSNAGRLTTRRATH